jgi:Ca-activated chloride channel family protein
VGAELRIAASPDIAGALGQAAADYRRAAGPACPVIHVDSVPAPTEAQLLGGPPAASPSPAAVADVTASPDPGAAAVAASAAAEAVANPADVWVPDSSAWLGLVPAAAQSLLPTGSAPVSLAHSPIVFSMSAPEAAALQAKGGLGWASLFGLVTQRAGWSQYGHPDWGPIAVQWPDPSTGSPGLLGLTAVSSAATKVPVAQLTQAVLTNKQVLLGEVTFVHGLSAVTGSGLDADWSTTPPAAVAPIAPVTERAVLVHDRAHPGAGATQLTAVYPNDVALSADYPYIPLKRPTLTGAKASLAQSFSDYLRSPQGQSTLKHQGFRTSPAADAVDFPTSDGVQPAEPARDVDEPNPLVAGTELVSFTKLQRLGVTLNVFDVSGSMGDQVPGTGETKLQLAAKAAVATDNFFSDNTIIGWWEFSTNLDGSLPYKTLVPLGPFAGRRELAAKALEAMEPEANTGLYATAIAAYAEVTKNYHPGYLNDVVLLTDGANDDPGNPLTLAQTVAKLKAAYDPAKPVGIITVAFGADADTKALQQLADATHGKSFSAKKLTDLPDVFIDVLNSF